jgi:hypothetical protein
VRRGLKRGNYTPSVEEILPGDAGEVPDLEETISYWTAGTYRAGEWLWELSDYWGPAGLMMRQGGEVLGFVVYGPREYLPRAGEYPLGPLDEDAVILAYAGGDARTRRHLLVRMLRDLRSRGVGSVEAIASDLGAKRHVSTLFLLECGWKPVRRGWRRGQPYTLVRTDLGSTVEVKELARDLIGRVRIPALKPTGGFVPGTLTRGKPAREHLSEANPSGKGYIA